MYTHSTFMYMLGISLGDSKARSETYRLGTAARTRESRRGSGDWGSAGGLFSLCHRSHSTFM